MNSRTKLTDFHLVVYSVAPSTTEYDTRSLTSNIKQYKKPVCFFPPTKWIEMELNEYYKEKNVIRIFFKQYEISKCSKKYAGHLVFA